MSDLSDHLDRGGFCGCCGTLWPCAAMRKAFLAQRAAHLDVAQQAAHLDVAQQAAPPDVVLADEPADAWFADPQ